MFDATIVRDAQGLQFAALRPDGPGRRGRRQN
jgi:hypothetical protein